MQMLEPWSLRVFFSVDVENSTEFKSSKFESGEDYEWYFQFRSFFKEFPKEFELTRSKISISRSACKVELPEVKPWKYLGDEILFQCELTDTWQILGLVKSFTETISNWNQYGVDKKRDIKCKGTIWTCGFPINNIVIPTGDGLPEDYLGSGVDVGFRISKLSTSEQVCLSLETAYIHSIAEIDFDKRNQPSSITEEWSKLLYSGRHILGGIYHNKPYPVFYVSLSSYKSQEEIWLGRGQIVKPLDLIIFAESIFSNNKLIRKPFIENDKSTLLSIVPNEMVKRRLKKMEDLESQVSGFEDMKNEPKDEELNQSVTNELIDKANSFKLKKSS